VRGKWRRAASLLLGPLTTWTGGRCGAVERPAGRHTGERRLWPGGRIRVASVGLVLAVSGIFAHVEPAASTSVERPAKAGLSTEVTEGPGFSQSPSANCRQPASRDRRAETSLPESVALPFVPRAPRLRLWRARSRCVARESTRAANASESPRVLVVTTDDSFATVVGYAQRSWPKRAENREPSSLTRPRSSSTSPYAPPARRGTSIGRSPEAEAARHRLWFP